MDQDLGFILEYLENTNDPTPLLIYADWLEERGDPRSELLRLHCEMIRSLEDEERYSQLEARLDKLVDEHRDWFVRPYARKSNGGLFAYILDPGGDHTVVEGTITQEKLDELTGHRSLRDNYSISDDAAVFWNSTDQGPLNITAMALIRDAENIHFNASIKDWEFLEEIRGLAVVVEGFREIACFRYLLRS